VYDINDVYWSILDDFYQETMMTRMYIDRFFNDLYEDYMEHDVKVVFWSILDGF